MDETPLRIPQDHPVFAGHFPGPPVVPGVMLLDEALSALAAAEGLGAGPWHLTAIRPTASADLVPLGRVDSMLQVCERLARGDLVGILGDRTLGDEPGLQVTLLGDPARLPTGPFRLASLIRRPVIFMTGLYPGGNRYQIHFSPLGELSLSHPRGPQSAIAEALHRYAGLIADHCRKAPYNWFNFFDFWHQPEAGS